MAYLNRAVTVMANLFWFLSSMPGYLRFRRALWCAEAFQCALLEDYLRNNRDTELGRKHRFSEIKGWDDFRTLPLTTGACFGLTLPRPAEAPVAQARHFRAGAIYVTARVCRTRTFP